MATSASGLNLTEIATALKLPKTSVLNVLRSLKATDFITSAHGRYALGSEALSLAAAITATASFPSQLLPQLRRLAVATNETVTLGVHSDDGLHMIYLEAIESSHTLRLSHSRGAQEPIYASSIGQALLAFMDEHLLANLLAQRQWPTLTKQTIDKGELVKKIPQIRKDGIATNVGGHEKDVIGIGAPVFDASGALRCAIATGAPIARLRPRQREFTQLVKSTAKEMSKVLGYHGHFPAPRPEFTARTSAAAKASAKVTSSEAAPPPASAEGQGRKAPRRGVRKGTS